MSAAEAQVTVDNSLPDFENLSPEEIAGVRLLCEKDHLIFTKWFFAARHGIRFLENWHHILISRALDKVLRGQTKNLLINLSPGASKTELLVNFMARGLALNPYAKFLNLSGSDQLAATTSQLTREIVSSDEFQRMWPRLIADDTKAKKRWNVMDGRKMAGGVYATSLGGQITGFRAGRLNAQGFQGAIVIDDPVKPEDAYSKVKLNTANRQLLSTVNSRRADPKTPIILIMQRIAENDPSGFIEQGNFGDDWEVLKIPAIIDDNFLLNLPPDILPKVKTQPQENGRFSYWPMKEPIDELIKREIGQGKQKDGSAVGRHVFAAQYMQKPQAIGGNLIHTSQFKRYKELPKLKYRKIYVDTAQKIKEKNDFTVFGEFGICEQGNLYLVDLFRAKLEAPDLITRGRDFWEKARGRDTLKCGQVRQMVVEDAASGTGLIQTFKRPPIIPVYPIIRTKDKLSRLMDILQYIEAGQVYLPESAPYLHDFVTECESFSADMTHAHDDQIDVLIDAITDLLGPQNTLEIWAKLGRDSRLGKGR